MGFLQWAMAIRHLMEASLLLPPCTGVEPEFHVMFIAAGK
jgi:hypothetical protein